MYAQMSNWIQSQWYTHMFGWNWPSSQWNTHELSCVANSCSSSSPSSVRNVVNADCATSSGSTCTPYTSGSRSGTYDCASGYDPSGTATCSLGSWSGGSCVDGSCKSNPTFGNFASLNGCTLNVASGTSCAFTCNTGYTPTGTLTCVRESWTNTASCVESSCSTSPGIDHELPGTCVGTASGATCAFQCEATHTPSGSPSCLRGEWTTEGAECILIEQCGVPAVTNGYYEASGWTAAQNGQDLEANQIYCNAGYSKNAQ